MLDPLFNLHGVRLKPRLQQFGRLNDQLLIVDLAAWLHDFHDGSINSEAAIIFNLRLNFLIIVLFNVFRNQNTDFVPNQIWFVVHVYTEFILEL